MNKKVRPVIAIVGAVLVGAKGLYDLVGFGIRTRNEKKR
jgi:hypothetical protein